MAFCSLFQNFHKPINKKSLFEIAADIASGKYKAPVEKLRALVKEAKTEEAQELKKKLPSFTPSGTFTTRRVKECIETYSGYVHLDFDKLTEEQINILKISISSNIHTHLFFVSPGGKGLKVFVEVNSGLEDHDIAYLQVQEYYEALTGFKADPSCKDISRLCFMSYDPQLYKNTNSERFIVKKRFRSLESLEGLGSLEGGRKMLNPASAGQHDSGASLLNPSTSKPSQPSQEEELFNRQVYFTNNKKTYTEGSRNAYLFLLATNCKEAGLPEQKTLELIVKNFDLPVKEIQSTVRSTYKHTPAKVIPMQPGKVVVKVPDKEDEEEEREIMPTLPDEIFDTLPDFLKRVVSVTNSKEERDVLLLGALTTLSFALHQVIGKYNDIIVNSNLYLFVSAIASAGKGILVHCRKLILPIHLRLREKTKLLKQLYDQELMDYKNNKSKNLNIEPPQKPPQMMAIIPGNNSATGFLEILNDSFKRGLIFETEGDTISQAFKSEYGDFSDSFRKAFQHEPISYYRRTDKEFVEIDRPCLSVLLSGTPRQINQLIPGVENGLFSRFMFYIMNMKQEWKNVFTSRTEKGIDNHFELLGNEFFRFYEKTEVLPESVFILTNEQQERFNTFFEQIQTLYVSLQDEDIISCVRRLGLTAFRIMMIFSALRMMETGEHPKWLVCNDVDFENTLEMISVLVKHSNYIFNQVSEEGKKQKPKKRKEVFFESLPAEFNRHTYLDIALGLQIGDSTAQRMIANFVKAGVIVNYSRDHYRKREMALPGKIASKQ
jgi:hypothetical protein